MYNREQKERYLNSDAFRFEESSKDVTIRIFESISEIELQKELDLSQFNKAQVYDLLATFNSTSKYYLRLVAKICFEYTNWCKSEGSVDKRHPNCYDDSFTSKIIDELVPLSMVEDKHFTRNYVIDLVSNVIKDPMNKFLTYAPFCGVCGLNCENLKYLRYSDINQSEKTVKLKSGITVTVDDLFIKLAKEADESTEYMPEGTSYDSSEDFETKKRIKNKNMFLYGGSSYILKSAGKKETDYKEVTQSFIIVRFKFIQKQVNNKFIAPSNLYKNGLINYIKEKFEEQGITLHQAFFEKIDKKNYVYTVKLKKYIKEYGSGISERQLRQEMQEVISLYE